MRQYIFLLVFIFSLVYNEPCCALVGDRNFTHDLPKKESLTRNIQHSITLEDMGLSLNNEDLPLVHRQELISTYTNLVDLARTLSPDLNSSISLKKNLEHDYSISGVKILNEGWQNLTIGHAINFISKAISRIDSEDGANEYIEILIKDGRNNMYYPLEGCDFNYFISLLLSNINYK
jgi:hypothetical protein